MLSGLGRDERILALIPVTSKDRMCSIFFLLPGVIPLVRVKIARRYEFNEFIVSKCFLWSSIVSGSYYIT